MGKQGKRRKRKNKPVKPCQNGDACYNPVCRFGHPSGQKRKGLLCKSGNECFNRECAYFHPMGLKRPGLFTKKCTQVPSNSVTTWNLNDPSSLQNDLIQLPPHYPNSLVGYKDLQKKCLRCEMFAQLRIDTLGLFSEPDKSTLAEFDSVDEGILNIKIMNPTVVYCEKMCLANGIDTKKQPISSWQKYCSKNGMKLELPNVVKIFPAGSLWVVSEANRRSEGDVLPEHMILKIDNSSRHLGGKLTRRKMPISFTAPKSSLPSFMQPRAALHSPLQLTPIKNLQCFTRVLEAIERTSTFQPVIRNALVGEVKQLGAENLQSYVPKEFRNYLASRLNDSQVNAIKVALKSPITNLIGPPGSGKSTTAIELLRTILIALRGKRGNRLTHIAVCAPSNQAVDVLFMKNTGMVSPDAQKSFMPFCLRIGNEENFSSTVRQNVQSVHLLTREIIGLTWMKSGKKKMDYEIEPLLEQLQSQIEDLENRHDDQILSIQTQIAQLRARMSAMRVSMNARYINQASREITRVFFDSAEIIFSTVNALGSIKSSQTFDCVMMDECCQVLEYESLIALQNASRVVNIGDPNQLRPTVLYHGPRRELLLPSLFERLQNTFPSPMLEFQYRMHPEIALFPSKYFYGGRLKNGENVKEYRKKFYQRLRAYQVVHVPGAEVRSGTSLMNIEEVHAAQKILQILSPFSSEISSIGIITPYIEQKTRLAEALYFPNLIVDTVDAFQGSECDVIILSCVRGGNDANNIGFLADANRLNVAITRAKFALIILGNTEALCNNQMWADLIADATNRGCIFHVDDFSATLI